MFSKQGEGDKGSVVKQMGRSLLVSVGGPPVRPYGVSSFGIVLLSNASPTPAFLCLCFECVCVHFSFCLSVGDGWLALG